MEFGPVVPERVRVGPGVIVRRFGCHRFGRRRMLGGLLRDRGGCFVIGGWQCLRGLCVLLPGPGLRFGFHGMREWLVSLVEVRLGRWRLHGLGKEMSRLSLFRPLFGLRRRGFLDCLLLAGRRGPLLLRDGRARHRSHRFGGGGVARPTLGDQSVQLHPEALELLLHTRVPVA